MDTGGQVSGGGQSRAKMLLIRSHFPFRRFGGNAIPGFLPRVRWDAEGRRVRFPTPGDMLANLPVVYAECSFGQQLHRSCANTPVASIDSLRRKATNARALIIRNLGN